MKYGFLQVWKHKTNDNVNLLILEQINEKYKVKISGPTKNMHLIEIVTPGYIKAHYTYLHTLEKDKHSKTKGVKNDS